MTRLAILPFENLTGDRSLDWIGPALSGVLAHDLSASVHTYSFRANTRRDALSGGAKKILEGYYTQARGQILYHAVVQDVRSVENERVLDAAGRNGAGLTTAAASMAKSMEKRTRTFPTSNDRALKAWGEAQLAADTAARQTALESAIKADPNFGLAYVELAQSQLEQGDAAGAAKTVADANQRLSMFSDLARARLDLIQATLSNRPDQKRTALRALTRLVTTDPSALVALAELELKRRSFESAVDLYRNALALEPDNVGVMNQLGYAAAYAGDLESATSVLERYQRTAPNEANPFDSLGEVYFFAGRFADAEKQFLAALKMNARFLGGAGALKAAEARLLQGELGGADALYDRYNQLRRAAKDPLADIEKAQWLFITGRRKQAMASVAAFANSARADARAYAEAQLAIWKLQTGDDAEARRLVSSAARDAASPRMAALVALCAAAAGIPESAPLPAGIPGAEQLQRVGRAYRLIFARQFREASELLGELYRQTSPTSDGDVRALYAWSLVATGRASEAAPLVRFYPIPLKPNTDSMFASLIYPRFLAVRGIALQSNQDRQLFRKYAGDVPSIFDRPANAARQFDPAASGFAARINALMKFPST